MKKLILVLSMMLAVNGFAMSETTSKTSVKNPNEKAAGTDKADELITNRAFRASGGSLSDWSVSTAFSYSGGSLSDPINAERPNLNAAGDIPAVQGLDGSVSISYRLTKKDRLNLGIGLYMMAPFHSSIDTNSQGIQSEFDDNQGELDFNNPALSYSRIGNINGIQSVLTVSATQYTVGWAVDRGMEQRLRATWNTMYNFKKTGFSAGILFLGSTFLNDDNETFANRSKQVNSEFAVLPQFEYIINDTFNLRTISRAFWFQNRETTSGTYRALEFTQSVGVGISITRDIFLYPNLQFKPNDLRADATNIGINANINMF